MGEWTEAKLHLDSKSWTPHSITLALMFRAAVTWTSGVTFLKSVGFYFTCPSEKQPRDIKVQ